jgi:hypothetical protein
MSSNLTSLKRYYTPREYAALTGISLSQVYAKMGTREILSVSVHGVKKIPIEWATEYLRSLEAEAREECAVEAVSDPTLARRGRVR